jgi:GAF domain-containing protein
MPRPDDQELRAGVDGLAGLPPTDLSLGDVIQRAIDSTDRVLGLSGAGLLLADDAHELRNAGSSDTGGKILEHQEAETGEGPCVDTVVYGRPVHSRDIGADPRYSRVGPSLAREGVVAVAGAPVPISGITVGALNAYHGEPHDWTEDELSSLGAYAHVLGDTLAVALLAQRHDTTAKQLRDALTNRIHIERAVGYLMGSQNLDARTAFNRLRADARRQRRKVADLARERLPGELDHS